MQRKIIDLPALPDDGRLYRDGALGMVESLLPNPWKSCHAPDLLELPGGDLLCCWFAGSWEGNADVSIAVSSSRTTPPAASRTPPSSSTPTTATSG